MTADQVKPATESEDELITCWCGAKGTYDQLFEDVGYRCSGSGVIYCYCGGDLCVCHNHGEVDCDGCPDCESDDENDDYLFEHDDEVSP